MFLTLEEILRELAYMNGQDPNASLLELIKTNKKYLFDFNYPIKDELWKDIFEELFCEEFINYKLIYPIEQYDMWELKLNQWLNLNMPYYIELLKSEDWFNKYITNPASNTDYTETYTRKLTGDIMSSTNATSDANENSNTTNTTNTSSKENTKNDIDSWSKANANTKSMSNANVHSESGIENVSSNLPKTQYDLGSKYASETGKQKTVQDSGTDTNATDNSESMTSGNTGERSENISNSKADSAMNINNTTKNESSALGTTKTDNTETYEFRRYGNIGVQTPGEVFTNTRKAFINTTKDILKNKELRQLFLLVY